MDSTISIPDDVHDEVWKLCETSGFSFHDECLRLIRIGLVLEEKAKNSGLLDVMDWAARRATIELAIDDLLSLIGSAKFAVMKMSADGPETAKFIAGIDCALRVIREYSNAK